jgi:hypothetical protein
MKRRRLQFERLDNRQLLTSLLGIGGGEAAADTPLFPMDPPNLADGGGPAEIAAEEAQLDASSAVLEGVGPRVRPGAEATRTTDIAPADPTGQAVPVDLELVLLNDVSGSVHDVAVVPDLAVAPADPSGQTAAPVKVDLELVLLNDVSG